MTEASYHLRTKDTHKMMQTNLNIRSRKTDEQNWSPDFSQLLFLLLFLLPLALGGKQRMTTVLGKNLYLLPENYFP